MAITNYTELKTAVANHLARTDLTTNIPDFITLAEARLSRELETREQEKRATATMTSGDEYIALPTDLREVREVKVNQNPIKVLEYMSPTSLDSNFASGSSGTPQAYSIVGQEIIYIGSLSALSDSNLTNIMLTRHPDAYLMGSLVEAYQYLMDDQRASLYDAKFTRIIEEIRKDEQRAHYGTGSLQIQSIYQRQNSAAQ